MFKYDVSNLKIGIPSAFEGVEVDIMIICGCRSSKTNDDLYTVNDINNDEDNVNLECIFSRARIATWIIGVGSTLNQPFLSSILSYCQND